MLIKKEYKVGEEVWIYGIGASNKLTKGQVVAELDLSDKGYGNDLHYIIAIPSHIEPLLEIRTWHTISQDDRGPVGSLRNLKEVNPADNKKIKQLGYNNEFYDSEEDPTPDEIMAALEKSTDGLTHKPLHIKESKPKRKYYPKRKKP